VLDVGTHTVLEPMMDGAHGLQRAKGALDVRERLVVPDRIGR
jgi:hypothetical protein